MNTDFKRRLHAGEPLVGTFVNLGSSLTAEIVGIAGFDWMVLDLEHGAGSEQSLIAQIQAVEHTGVAALVRVEGIEPARILHALDLGAAGVLVPRLSSAQDARRCVECCRYAGVRGVARYNRSWSWGLAGGSLAEADERVVCAVQIETTQALAEVDQIASVEGVDVIFVGPADLAHALGLHCPPDDPRLLEQAGKVAAAAAAHGKAAGMLVGTVEQARAYRGLGFSFLGCASDSGLLANAARGLVAEMKQLGSPATEVAGR